MINALRNTIIPEVEPPMGPLEPSQPRALPTNGNGMGRDEFLKLLVAQMKHQDPLNPMDGKDMVAQLAQFSSVEQLIAINKNVDEQRAAQSVMADLLEQIQVTQIERADELAMLIEGQMAVSTVGKNAVAEGNTLFVDKDGSGSVVIDSGTRSGAGRLSIVNEDGQVITSASVAGVREGQQGFDLSDFNFEPPLKPGKYTYRFEVAKDGTSWQQVKTYTTGRITGLKYENGNPILIIADTMSLPMSKLTQIRG